MDSRSNAAERDPNERANRRRRTRLERRDGYRQLDPLAFGLATGIAWALAVGLVGLAAKVGRGRRLRSLLSDVYVGFEPDEGTALAGVAWGFVDGFAGGALVAWLYDRVGDLLPDRRRRTGW